jgi:hypothetical protein
MGHINQYNATRTVRADGESVTQTETNAVGDISMTLGTALDDVNDSITTYPKCSYTNTAASALIKTGAGQVYGVIINSHNSGTLKLWDNTAGSGTVICNTITFAAGERFIPLLGATFGTGLYATIGGTAADITILYR